MAVSSSQKVIKTPTSKQQGLQTMALVERFMALFIVMEILQVSDAAVYKVGDSAGWTTLGKIDYKKWAATKNFQIGDTIIFEYYNKFHNVMRVTHGMYKSCNASSPIATFTTGNDSIHITTHGHHFFFCGVPGHCEAGQKVDINVLKVSAEAPTPSALASPIVQASNVPAPSPSNANSLIVLKGPFSMVSLAMAIVLLLCFL
ncbi:mavicyanin-like [Vigna umbellata]|uniref:mavicyanin-like n=1 Tax=Vigna umbellata TaxID=87088 RepID=UPI001F5E9ABF|nr:mavicyanin-like [Vigna umbellata]